LREQFDRALQARITDTRQHRSIPILCLCLDQLRKINETLGYRAGDLLLKTTANLNYKFLSMIGNAIIKIWFM
jgi:GGDEF domain-containing protein